VYEVLIGLSRIKHSVATILILTPAFASSDKPSSGRVFLLLRQLEGR
jgi:hypothetical protein